MVTNLRNHRPPSRLFNPKHLVVLLESDGGIIETVERIVDVMRENYEKVSVVIPNFAFSAGTVLALTGDEIYMNYFSVLGPIDVQVSDSFGNFASGYGILKEHEDLMKTINEAETYSKVRAEITILTRKMQVPIFEIEQSILYGKNFVTDSLVKYKFKDWKVTENRKIPVTQKMKRDRALKIAEKFSDAEMWHSHGRGITMDRLESEGIKLLINDFGKNKDLESKIEKYRDFAVDFFKKQGYIDYIHSRLGAMEVKNE